ncbi:hypothetical protein [Paenibacillus sp. OV219]|uniref:hypothetical protein n=1 Tax=Paenibacillus sp. OV219 TaxID=1884377 RepID=UPI0015A68E43|nr:hypothetical protein [Paenibacillus sp. OV219]
MAAKLVRKGGTIQVTGVYGVIHYIPELYRQVKDGVFDPTDIISQRIGLDEAEHGFKIFNNKEDNAMKIILKP